jgi:general stress protein YciG
MANKGQFSKGQDASKMGKKGGKASGGNTKNLKNVGDSVL